LEAVKKKLQLTSEKQNQIQSLIVPKVSFCVHDIILIKFGQFCEKTN